MSRNEMYGHPRREVYGARLLVNSFCWHNVYICDFYTAKMLEQRSSVLYLEDGSSFTGYGFGAARDISGEVGM